MYMPYFICRRVPARVRSRITPRSNSAKEARMLKINPPVGESWEVSNPFVADL